MSIRSSDVSAGRTVVTLDPCSLGRPYHLLEPFHARLRSAFQAHFAMRFNHRHGASFVVGDVAMSSRQSSRQGVPWFGFTTSLGHVSVRIPRRLLLSLLAVHYGDLPASVDDTSPVTPTEQRFSVEVLRSMAVLLTSCSPFAKDPSIEADEHASHDVGGQVLCVEVREESWNVNALIELAIDDAWLARLLADAAARRSSAGSASCRIEPLGGQLPITLRVELAGRDASMDELLSLMPGDVVPLRPPDAVDVLVHDTRLFTAVVAEQCGQLCLTSFQLASEHQ